MLPVGNVTTNASTNAITNANVNANVATAYAPRFSDVDNDIMPVKHPKSYANKREIILSCSHVFHAKCIANFERFLRATVSKFLYSF